MARTLFLLFVLTVTTAFSAGAEPVEGYYRYPSISGETIVFTAEGDLWRVPVAGGTARRLTTHHGFEYLACISPDGGTVAFCGQYEGPSEVYTIPVEGGVPKRLTWQSGAYVEGWTPDGRIIYSTNRYSTLPGTQLVLLDPATGKEDLVPLAQASEGCWTPDGGALYFTRLPHNGSQTKRYQGGTIQHIWKFRKGSEAEPLTDDFAGTSKDPMYWQGRIYFLSDRDGTMNIWSFDGNGSDLRQHTFHKGLDASEPSLDDGRIAYQHIADIRVYDIASDSDRKIDIRLASDFDQMREKWVNDPSAYLTAVNISDDGSHVALTARGQVFVAPVEEGRLVRVTRSEGVRHRSATFMPGGKRVLFYSDESGELELHTAASDGSGGEKTLTSDGKVLRFEGIPSSDGKYVAYTDKNYRLWILDVEKGQSRQIDESGYYNFSGITWSPGDFYLAYTARAKNHFSLIRVYDIAKKVTTDITSDRVDSYSPAWSPDGKWIYFLSDRTFNSIVRSPWGLRNPEPFFDRMTKIYAASLQPGERSPWIPDDEVYLAEKKKEEDKKDKKEKKEDKDDKTETAPAPIEFDGISERVIEVPVPEGNYSSLTMNDKTLFFTDRTVTERGNTTLKGLDIEKKDAEIKEILSGIGYYKMSGDRKKLLVFKSGNIYVIDAGASAPSKLDKAQVNLQGWAFPIDPREEWRQMFVEAWRLERDYFYDLDMHKVDYDRILNKYLPWVDRVTDRRELSDLISHLVGELSTLHTFVVGGDVRYAPVNINQGSLGALLEKDEKKGGYRIEHIYRGDPEILYIVSPLALPGSRIEEGDLITSVDGVPVTSVGDISLLLRNTVNKQVLLGLTPAGKEEPYEAIVNPISTAQEYDLRYHQWENERRMMVEDEGKGDLGYVHLRAMGGVNISEWARNFYPVFDRKGLIIDVRHNRGGNIDSWILEKLLRKAWFFWKPRVGDPFWNMQYAFRGHIVVLCNEYTASDGEAFAEGFKRLGLGKVIGTRTWGGEVWLSFSNYLVDRGIASAAELGVYGPEGEWLIEGHGVDPDIVVDNLPVATFEGKDAQLEAAIRHLQRLIREEPVEVPDVPEYPDKSFKH